MEIPRGFMASVIIWAWPTETKTWPSVVRHGNGEQRGDGPALDDVEVAIGQAPLDVLRASEVRFDPPAELRERENLRIGQCCPVLKFRPDRHLLGPAGR